MELNKSAIKILIIGFLGFILFPTVDNFFDFISGSDSENTKKAEAPGFDLFHFREFRNDFNRY